MTKETTIRAIGNSAGVTIPKPMLERYHLSDGSRVTLVETERHPDPAVRRDVRGGSAEQPEAVLAMLALAAGEMDEPALAEWLRAHTEPR